MAPLPNLAAQETPPPAAQLQAPPKIQEVCLPSKVTLEAQNHRGDDPKALSQGMVQL